MAFWQIIVIFSIAAALFVTWPLIKAPFSRKAAAQKVDHDETQVELYREHLADLEKSLERGELEAAQFEELKLELQKTLVSEGVVGDRKFHSGGKKLTLAVAVLVPVLSLVLYTQWGQKKDWDIYQLLESLPKVESREEYDKKLRELVVLVQARLNQTPDNIQLVNLLAQTAMMPEMLGLAGIDAKNQGDYRAAIRYWKTAVQHMDPNSRVAQGYLNGIAKAEQALVAAGEKLDSADKPAADPNSARIQLQVSLADSVQISGGETLFVYARAWQGPKMPLAIQKLSASQLPVSITLDESMAMAPGMTIKSFPELELVARISRTGSPTAQPGDWQGSIGPVKLDSLEGVQQITISEQLP